MKHNRTTLKKIEEIFEAQGYRVRYEKGSFESGHCIVHQSHMVLINKFFDLEGRIQKLSELLTEIEIDETTLDEKQLQFLKKLARNWQSATA